MHIVYLIERIDNVGGIQRSLTARANYLVETYNYKITIVCTVKDSGEPAFKLNNNIDLLFLEPLTSKKSLLGRIFLRYKQAREVIHSLKPDIVITVKFTLHNLFFQLIPSKVKFISEIRESYDDIHRKSISTFKSLLNKKMINFFLQRQDAVIVLTERDKELWGFKKMYAIPNPQTIKSNEVSDLSHKQVLAIGRLSKVKGFDKLIDVWQIVNQKHSDWNLKICGEGEEYEYLQEKINSLGLNESVVITNKFLPVIPEFLESSIYALSSQFESFGNVLVEAKICGLPVVSFDAPNGPREIVMEGQDGFVVKANDVEEMATKIIFLIENKDILVAMGKKAKLNSVKYDLKSIVELYNNILKLTVN